MLDIKPIDSPLIIMRENSCHGKMGIFDTALAKMKCENKKIQIRTYSILSIPFLETFASINSFGIQLGESGGAVVLQAHAS
jgi:hypothetical protein